MVEDSHALEDGELDVAIGRTIVVTLTWHDGEPSAIELPRPGSGYGGHELVVSEDERYAVLWLHSGQSQVGYEVFELSSQLRHVFSLPYELGTGDAPTFSDNSRWLVMLVRTRAYDWYDADGNAYESRADADKTWMLEWADVYALRLPRAQLTKAAITLTCTRPPSADDLGNGWETYGRLRVVGYDDFEVVLPSGYDESIELPPRDATFEIESPPAARAADADDN